MRDVIMKKKSFSHDGQQFHHYQQPHLLPQNHWLKWRPRHIALEIRKIQEAVDLQSDLSSLEERERKWQMCFHPDKCTVSRVPGKRVPSSVVDAGSLEDFKVRLNSIPFITTQINDRAAVRCICCVHVIILYKLYLVLRELFD